MPISYAVREFREDDDFEMFDQMAWNEHSKRAERLGVRMQGAFTHNLQHKIVQKEHYFAAVTSLPLSKGYVLEADSVIAAILTVTLQHTGGNGTVHKLGLHEGHEPQIEPLLSACASFVRENGGDKLYCFAEILPGQIRNPYFDYWEHFGFKPESYYSQWLVCHDFSKWEVPDFLEIDGVLPAGELDVEQIAAILEEDDERYIAEMLRFEYAEPTPDHVFLKLCSPDSGQIVGIAYYRINRHDNRLGTNTLGIHIRPFLNDQSSYGEIQRFVRCVLASMKQLNLAYAGTRMSSRNLLSMIALCAEGFILAPMGQAVLYRSV